MVKTIERILEEKSRLNKEETMFLIASLIESTIIESKKTDSFKKVQQDIQQIMLNILDKHLKSMEIMVFLGEIAQKIIERHPKDNLVSSNQKYVE